MYKRYHCLNCGRKFSRVYDRRRHEKLVSCEKKEIYNDVEILVRMSSLEKEVLELKKLYVELMCMWSKVNVKEKKKKGKKGKGSGTGTGTGTGENSVGKKIKQSKILDYGLGMEISI